MAVSKLKEMHIKDHTCCYIDDEMNVNDIDFKNIATDKKTPFKIFLCVILDVNCIYY